MTSVPNTDDRVRILDRQEGHKLFDEAARRNLNMSGEEFIRKLDAGEFGNPDDRPEVIAVAMLRPFST